MDLNRVQQIANTIKAVSEAICYASDAYHTIKANYERLKEDGRQSSKVEPERDS